MMRPVDEQSRFQDAQDAWLPPDASGRDSVLDVLGSRQRQRSGKMRNPLEGYTDKNAKPSGARHGRRRGPSDSSDVTRRRASCTRRTWPTWTRSSRR